MANEQKKPINLSFPWKVELDYMTQPEKIELDRLRDRLSFFRVLKCELVECEAEVIKGKRFCSKDHADENMKRLAQVALKKQHSASVKAVSLPKKKRKTKRQDAWKE
jgi:hypothetical protein